jgi:hypothetical protein
MPGHPIRCWLRAPVWLRVVCKAWHAACHPDNTLVRTLHCCGRIGAMLKNARRHQTLLLPARVGPRENRLWERNVNRCISPAFTMRKITARLPLKNNNESFLELVPPFPPTPPLPFSFSLVSQFSAKATSTLISQFSAKATCTPLHFSFFPRFSFPFPIPIPRFVSSVRTHLLKRLMTAGGLLFLQLWPQFETAPKFETAAWQQSLPLPSLL